MRPEFAAAIDAIFERTIELLERLESGTVCNAAHERDALLELIGRADVFFGAAREWELARYAIAAWIDEMLLAIPWDGAAWWRNHILEMELFRTRICSVRFFELAKDASAFRHRDALEVFYNCVILGFRGMYAGGNLSESPPAHEGWPESIEQWMERTSLMIDVAPYQPSDETPQRTIAGARPLAARSKVVWWSVAAGILLAINIVINRFLMAHS